MSVKGRLDRGPVETFLADHDQPPASRLLRSPQTIKLLTKARPDALHQQPHRFSRHIEESLDPQNIVARGDLDQAPDESLLICKGGNLETNESKSS